MSGGSMDALLEAAASSTASPPLSCAPTPSAPPSFLSPEPATMTARDHMQRTLSEGARKKQQQKRKLVDRSSADAAHATPTILKRKKKLPIGDTPQSATSKLHRNGSVESIHNKENEPNANIAATAALAGAVGTEKPRKMKSDGRSTAVETATRRLEFAATTPNKPTEKKARKELTPESSSSSSSSEEDDDGDHSSASSDECEVSFDTVTVGKVRIVREAVSSPLLTASTASTKPIGLEYQFAVSSTVSSIAVAPDGKFLVVGFYNGTIYLYPLTQDSLRYRHGVMLDHISARGIYTQLMVRVALPDDGKFIFAGVYRGSTEIRAFEVDSIELPSLERLAQAATARGTDGGESDHEIDHEEGTGTPTAHAITHMYSDAKLKGFSDVKSVVRKSNNKTEYHLLCGLGIKNIHLWRFFHDDTVNEWAWECIFDKQNNGISIEMLCFHRSIDNQIIAKSEHQNIRVWNLEEDSVSSTLTKKAHIDIKQSVDATAVYGDHAYGGGEALALIDLRSSSRMELDLPLSVKEQEAKQASARVDTGGTRITASLRGRRGTRGRGFADDASNGQRLMRMVSQVAGHDASPFVVGMCTDGSVFMHRPQPDTMGLATPLEYVEGYEQYFQDPSLSFQEKFSDLTRVNTSGQMAVLPLPKTEEEEWMVVAANANQLLVRSMDAFLHRNQQKQAPVRVKRGLRNAFRDTGNNASSSDSDMDDDSSSDEEEIIIRKPASRAAVESAPDVKREKQQVKLDAPKVEGKNDKLDDAVKAKPEKPKKVNKAVPVSSTKVQASSTKPLSEQTDKPLPVAKAKSQSTDEQADNKASTLVSTPVRTERFYPRSAAVPSPVVSISSPSASSNPNTPERIKQLSESERRALVVNDLQWTPQAGAQTESHVDNQLVEVTKNDDSSHESSLVATKRVRSQKRKPGKRTRGVAQALFVNDEPQLVETEDTASAQTSLKRPAQESLEGGPTKKLAVAAEESTVALALVRDDEECTDVEDECEEMFTFTPLQSDGGSLLAAAIYQYSPHEPASSTLSRHFNAEEIELMMRFSSQLERLKRSYAMDRERVMRQFTVAECDCGGKKKVASAVTKLNWRKQVSSEASKKKHMKRRQKKLLAARLREIHTSYEARLSDIQIIQRLELQAFTARQEFQLLASQV